MSKQSLSEPIRLWLKDALEKWKQSGLINSDQSNGILALYEDDVHVHDRSHSMVSFALFSLGAFLFGLSALLLIGFNWEAMPRVAKLATALAVIAGTHFLGFKLHRGYRTLSEIVFFLGCLLFGAGIWLIAQAYHLDAHYPDGIYWWAIGVLPFALVLDSLLIHVLFVALMAIWAGIETLGYVHLRPWWAWGLLPNGAWSLLVLATPGLVWAYRRPSQMAVGLYVGLFAWWVILQAFVWRFGFSSLSVFWIGSVGSLLLVAAEAHRPGHPMAIPVRLWGALLTAGALIPMSSRWYWHDLSRTPVGADWFEEFWSMLLVTGVAFGLLALAGVALCGKASLRRVRLPAGLLVMMIGLTAWTLLVPLEMNSGLVPILLANAAMIGLAIYLINIGAREERMRPFGAGVIYFLIWSIARYLDLFNFAGGMLGAAAIFALCGFALVVIARFWARLKRQEPSVPESSESSWPGPAWASGALNWIRDRSRPVLIGAIGFHLLFLVVMIAVESAPLIMGRTITLRVRPVDPRDFFRGDYVVLNYEINQMLPNNPLQAGGTTPSRKPVYVVVEPDAEGPYWHGVSARFERPTTGTYLIGSQDRYGWRGLRFGIEAYYVQEGEGLKWEDAARRGKLSAEVVVSPWGRAKLKRLFIEEPGP